MNEWFPLVDAEAGRKGCQLATDGLSTYPLSPGDWERRYGDGRTISRSSARWGRGAARATSPQSES